MKKSCSLLDILRHKTTTDLRNQEKRVIFVIDEYPYLAKAKPAISAMLQHIIDHKWTDSKMYLILCGSSMSFMENQVLGKESPLYGRQTGQLKIEPLDYSIIQIVFQLS